MTIAKLKRWLIFAFLITFTLVSVVACKASSNGSSPLGIFAVDPSQRYLEVKELLEKQMWKQANTEISEIALSVAGRSNEGWFDANSIKEFPCSDLYYIDQLMMKHSQGRFGLTAQREVYQELEQQGLQKNENEEIIFQHFAEAVGWIKDGEFIAYPDLFFNLDQAPKGHLPVKIPRRALRTSFKSRDGSPDVPRNYTALMRRLEICEP
ncbi:GUN4 domain-containing protein [Crocosphaera sp. Alani8]|uniref:GUN4 domain-containing protein n=1 Tax=Crocosphaera sp. Alani8 TaxID=3038952 RepID=UPI00313CE4CD